MILYLIRWSLYLAMYTRGRIGFLFRWVCKSFPYYENFLYLVLGIVMKLYPPMNRSHREPLYSWIVRCNRVYGVTFMFVANEINEMQTFENMLDYCNLPYTTKRVRGAWREFTDHSRRIQKAHQKYIEYRQRHVLYF